MVLCQQVYSSQRADFLQQPDTPFRQSLSFFFMKLSFTRHISQFFVFSDHRHRVPLLSNSLFPSLPGFFFFSERSIPPVQVGSAASPPALPRWQTVFLRFFLGVRKWLLKSRFHTMFKLLIFEIRRISFRLCIWLHRAPAPLGMKVLMMGWEYLSSYSTRP